ncbi:MAG: response regulator [Burkholderiaceae bacterium]|nr:response regulator [Burkholderiaceae bacterium]
MPISSHAVSAMLMRVYQLSAALCLLVLVVLVPFFITRKTLPTIGAAIGLAAALAGIAALRRGLAKPSMWLMVFAVWSASALMTFGGLPHVMMPLVLATSVVVAIVIGSRAAAGFGGSFLAFWLSIRVATDLGWTTPVLYERHWITWMMAGTSFAMIMLPILALLDEQRRALATLSREIGERRRAEQAMRGAAQLAEAASRAKSEFLANMSHEIRTPMNGILGMLQLTMLTDLTGAQRSRLGHAEDAARSLLRIIDDILDLSKIEAGRLELESVGFSLDQAMTRLSTLVRPGAIDKGLAFDIVVDDDVPRWLVGDPLRLGQVLLNLCSNAVKFTERGSVQVRVTRRDRAPSGAMSGAIELGADAPAAIDNDGVELDFSVTDTGIGIGEGDRKWLFQSFSQADSSTTRRFGGTGLGLTISKRLTERMGGRIDVESALGRGSRFRFNVPFGLADSPPTPASAARGEASGPGIGGARVLLVEDNRINQEVARTMLQAAGAHVEVASDGAQAIAALARAEFDAVLMDVQMPVMDGLEATRRLRRDPRHASLPIIAMTANALADDREACLAAGMTDYFTKPISMQSLVQTVSRNLAVRPA